MTATAIHNNGRTILPATNVAQLWIAARCASIGAISTIWLNVVSISLRGLASSPGLPASINCGPVTLSPKKDPPPQPPPPLSTVRARRISWTHQWTDRPSQPTPSTVLYHWATRNVTQLVLSQGTSASVPVWLIKSRLLAAYRAARATGWPYPCLRRARSSINCQRQKQRQITAAASKIDPEWPPTPRNPPRKYTRPPSTATMAPENIGGTYAP